MDAETVRTIAGLVRMRAKVSDHYAKGDGMMHLGAMLVLRQLAADLKSALAP